MRVQLIRPRVIALAIMAMTAAPGGARAQVDDPRQVTVGLRVYADDDRVTVWSPSARAAAPLPHGVTVDVATTVDAVTAASIDGVSTASPYAFTETRIEGGVGLTVEVRPRHAVTARVIGSDERDYTALRLSAGWRAELAARNTTVDLTFTAGLDTVGRAGDPTFARDRRELRGALALTQITDRRGYVDLVVEAADQRGYLANPYRFVPIEMAGAVAYTLPERAPDQRTAVAALVRVRRALTDAAFVHGDYRLSRDTWGVTSNTATLRLSRAMRADELLLGVEARGYRQDAASFHRAVYAGDSGAPAWRTSDRALGRMASATAGVVAESTVPWHGLRVSMSAAWVHFWWLDDLRQSDRDAVVASLGLVVPL